MYKPIIRKNASDKEMLWASRFVVLAIAIVAVLIAANPNSGTIMGLVENAWGVFGAAFGPAILLSLFWKRFTFSGAVAGIAVGLCEGRDMVDAIRLGLACGTANTQFDRTGYVSQELVAQYYSQITATVC